MKCDGECNKPEDCKGVVRKVKVTGNGLISPWFFNYCETAIEVDKSRGFIVEEVDNDYDKNGLAEGDYYTGITREG